MGWLCALLSSKAPVESQKMSRFQLLSAFASQFFHCA
jgi:hypothetical protein